MNIPRLRVSDKVQISNELLCRPHNTNPDGLTECEILFPITNGNYLLKTPQDAYVAISGDDLVHCSAPFFTNDVERKCVRVVFFGNGQFALPTLRMLVEKGYDVAAVVTMQDKPCGRGKAPRESIVKQYAKSIGLRVLQPESLTSKRFLKTLSSLKATVGVVVEFTKLPREVFDTPQYGILNLHSSLLPMHRGASSITEAIRDDKGYTGVTVIRINDGIDKGNIINNLCVPIIDVDTSVDIHAHLREVGAELMDDAICRVVSGDYGAPIPQSLLECDFITPSYAPKLKRAECQIDWTQDARTVFNFIRSVSGIPCAWSLLLRQDRTTTIVKIHEARITNIPRGERECGEVFWQGRKLLIACQDYAISAEILQFPNKQKITALEYFNGCKGRVNGCCIYKDV